MPKPPSPRDAADWLSLAAAPTFALMAILTAVLGGDTHGAFSVAGMVPMYLLMSAFHSAHWLKPITGRRSGVTVGH